MIHKIINKYIDPTILNRKIDSKKKGYLLGTDKTNKTNKTNEMEVHEILTDIYKNGIIKEIGVIQHVEGGLTIDYFDKTLNTDCRFVMGFTELSYWAYCNTTLTELQEACDNSTGTSN